MWCSLSLTWIFWTAGAASITAALGGGLNCSKIKEDIVYCNQLNALEGFAWLSWCVLFPTHFILFVETYAVPQGRCDFPPPCDVLPWDSVDEKG